MVKTPLSADGVVSAYSEGTPSSTKESLIIDEIDFSLVELGIAELESMRMQQPVELVLSANFDQSVRSREANLTGSSYTFQRPDGLAVAARALVGAGGESVVVIHAAFFSANPTHHTFQKKAGLDTERFVRRLLRHEGWHVALQQRGEGPLEQARTLDPDGTDIVALLAANLIDEYRVERTMFDDGWWRGTTDIGTATLISAFRRLRHAPILPADDSVESFLETRLGRGQGLTQLIAHEAARVVVQGLVANRRLRGSHVWRRVGGSFWEETLQILRRVPAAADLADSQSIRAAVEAEVPVVHAWLALAKTGHEFVEVP